MQPKYSLIIIQKNWKQAPTHPHMAGQLASRWLWGDGEAWLYGTATPWLWGGGGPRSSPGSGSGAPCGTGTSPGHPGSSVASHP